jgi:hypothetical protein
MCWGKLPRHPGRAHAWPLCGPWPRPHLAAAKLVELRSSVNLVAMPHQPLDRPVASLTNPGLRDVRCAHIAPPWAVLGSPRCGCRGESQRAGDTNPGCLGVAPSEAANEITSPQLRLRSPRRGRPEESPVRGAKRRCAGGNCPDTQAEHTLGLFAARGRGRIWPPRNSLNCGLRSTWSRCHTNRSTAPSRRSPTQGCATFAALTSLHPGLSWGRRVAAAAARAKGQETPTQAVLGSPPSEAGRCDRHWLRSQGSLSQWHEEASAWGSSPSRLCVLGRSLSHAAVRRVASRSSTFAS